MCLNRINNHYVAMLPEEDFLDTFGLMVGKGAYSISPQSSTGGRGSQVKAYIELPTYDSIFIFHFPAPGSGPVVDGWPTLNGKKFLFYYYGIIKHENRDTVYSRLRWIGLGSGEDLCEPLDFKMHKPPKPE